MKKNTILVLVVLISIAACRESQKKSDLDNMLDKIENGHGDESDLTEFIESQGTDGTYYVNSTQAKFKINFPVINVKESTTKQQIANKEVEIVHFTANMQGKEHVNLGYQLDYVYLPEINSEKEINNLFNEQRDYVLSATNGKLEFEKIIEKNNAPGRHIYLTIDDSELKTNYKMYFKNGFFYKLAVVTENGKLFNESIDKFFGSFVMTE